jgi:hypothetical protein
MPGSSTVLQPFHGTEWCHEEISAPVHRASGPTSRSNVLTGRSPNRPMTAGAEPVDTAGVAPASCGKAGDCPVGIRPVATCLTKAELVGHAGVASRMGCAVAIVVDRRHHQHPKFDQRQATAVHQDHGASRRLQKRPEKRMSLQRVKLAGFEPSPWDYRTGSSACVHPYAPWLGPFRPELLP